MRNLDETDLRILQLLRSDARRPYSDIADAVSLSPPAVSDRINRLEEIGVIERFTVQLDRELLHHGRPVLVTLTPMPAASVDLYRELGTIDAVAAMYRLADGQIVLQAHLPDADVSGWLADHISIDSVDRIEVDPLVEADEHAELQPDAFDLSCVVCGNEVGPDGELKRFDGEVKPFCCTSCLGRYEDEYETRKAQAADAATDD